MTQKDKAYYLEEELLLVENSGEIPEVAYHGSLYFLREDPEGPRLTLSDEELAPLRKAVFDRYCRIILRDLNPALRKKRVYRGLARCIANWARLVKFSQREDLNLAEIRLQTADALRRFLLREIADIENGAHPSINCSAEALAAFISEFGIRQEELPQGWQQHCFNHPPSGA
ncbi:MAG: hypothetical protein P8130_09065 [Deltaproteobacteria bacterium]